MWIDYEKSKKAVERDLYACRDYILKGYFSIGQFYENDGLSIGYLISHYHNRFNPSCGAYMKIPSGSHDEDPNLQKLLDQDEQEEWLENVVRAINHLEKEQREVIIYHYLKGYSLNALKAGITERMHHIKISKSHEKNRKALLVLLLYRKDCLVPYEDDINDKAIVLYKVGGFNFVIKKKHGKTGRRS